MYSTCSVRFKRADVKDKLVGVQELRLLCWRCGTMVYAMEDIINCVSAGGGGGGGPVCGTSSGPMSQIAYSENSMAGYCAPAHPALEQGSEHAPLISITVPTLLSAGDAILCAPPVQCHRCNPICNSGGRGRNLPPELSLRASSAEQVRR